MIGLYTPGSLGGEMQCPTCGQHTPDNWRRFASVPGQQSIPTEYAVEVPGPDQSLGRNRPPAIAWVTVDRMVCANPECGELVVRLHEARNVGVADDGTYVTETHSWFVRPRNRSRQIDGRIPPPLRDDYLEAAAILDPSPRMSAVLSRRILADVLEQYAGLNQFSLSERIEQFIRDPRYPRPIRENLHHLREAGDFGAHTQKDDQAAIINVDRVEAEWTLDILDRLFDYFVTGPELDRQVRVSMDKKLADAGRKPINPLPPDSEDVT